MDSSNNKQSLFMSVLMIHWSSLSFILMKKESQQIKSNWEKSYPRVIESLINKEHIITFDDFPESIRQSIYSTNLIEAFNKESKR